MSGTALALLPYVISGMAEAGKLGLQWFFISQALEGKTPEETRAYMDAEYEAFQKKDPATLTRFDVTEEPTE